MNQKELNNKELLQYLANQTKYGTLQDAEKALDEDEFLKEAYEGLQAIGNQQQIEQAVTMLDAQLQKSIKTQKAKRRKFQQPNIQWSLLAVGLILLLTVLAYVVLHFMI